MENKDTSHLDISDESKKLIKPYSEGFFVSVPTKTTTYFRVNILWQIFRFIYINLKMIIMIHKSHDPN